MRTTFLAWSIPNAVQATKSKINHVSFQQLPGHINSMGPKMPPVFLGSAIAVWKAVGIFNWESMLGPTGYKAQTRRKKNVIQVRGHQQPLKGSLNHPKKGTKNYQVITLQGTNISHQKSLLKMVGYVTSLESYICNGLQSSFVDSIFEVTTPGWKTREKQLQLTWLFNSPEKLTENPWLTSSPNPPRNKKKQNMKQIRVDGTENP